MGIPKDAYFRLTPAETVAICEGYVHNRDMMQANFRMLYGIQYNQWSKPRKTNAQLWPIPSIDGVEVEPISEAEMYERNKEIIENYKKLTGLN